MAEASGTILIYTTFPSEEDARRIGEELVRARLAGCVNMFPGMKSLYSWEGKIEEGSETAMIIKTRAGLMDAVFDAVKERHPYSVPALFAIPVERIGEAYRDWLLAQTLEKAPSRQAEG